MVEKSGLLPQNKIFLVVLTISALFLFLPSQTAVSHPSSNNFDLNTSIQTEPQTKRPFTPTTQFRHLTTSDGLPVNNIEDIYQDSRGFIWIGTSDGLARYDGYTVTTYKHDPDNENSLSHNHVKAIVEDDNGRLWLATSGGGINLYDPIINQFTHIQVDPDDPTALGNSIVVTAFKDSQNNIWFGSPPPTSLVRINADTHEITTYREPEGIHGAGWGAVADDQGDFWIITDNALNRFDPQTNSFTNYAIPSGEGRLFAIVQDGNGRLLFGGVDGLYTFDQQRETVTKIGDFPAIDDLLLVNDQLWIATNSAGLYVYDPETDAILHHFMSDITNPHSLSSNHVKTLFADDAGLVWLGTQEGGIDLFDPYRSQFAHYRHDPNDENSLAETAVSAISGDALGNLWVLNKSGWDYINFKSGQVSRYKVSDYFSEVDSSIPSILYDSQGMVWMGLSDGELIQFNPETESAKLVALYAPRPDDGRPRPQTPIVSMAEDDDGNLWVVGMRDGLYRLDSTRQDIQQFPIPVRQTPPDAGTLAAAQITSVMIDQTGSVWLGYQTGELSRLDTATGEFTHYMEDNESPSGNPGGHVNQIIEDENGRLWLATREGLTRFDPTNETFTQFTEKDGLPTNSIQAVQQAANGDLWVSTSNGLAQFDPAIESVKQVFDVADGLQADEFLRATWQDENGRFYFGGTNGITAFYPDQIQINTHQPPVLLTELRLFNEPVCCSDDNSMLNQAIWNTEELSFAYDEDVISFDFAALSYAAPEKNQYRYRLEGFEDAWNEVGSDRRTATYTNLPAGTYTLHIQGSNNHGVWSDNETAVTIIVNPPWWETVWFRLLAVVTLIGMVIGLFRWRVWRIEQRNRELEAEVERQTAVILEAEAQKQRLAVLEERQRIGRDLHDDLGQIIGYISVQSQTVLAQLPTHDDVAPARTALARLIQVAQDAHSDVRQYILGIRTGEKRQPTAFIPALKEYLQTLKSIFDFQTQLSLPPNWKESPCTPEAETQLLRIIQESLTNARKHAGTNEANLIFTDHIDAIQVIISDKGKGFDPLAVIRNPSTETSQPITDHEPRTTDHGPRTTDHELQTTDHGLQTTPHFGLTIMRERAEKVGGSLNIRSAPGEGTQIIVQMPKQLESSHPEDAVKGLRVMLVDDHQLYLEGIHNLLRTRGVQVIGTANNGLEAHEKAAALQPDLILMDVDMPIRDGLEATKQIKEQWPDIKIVMLTVSAEEEKLLTALRYGASGYLLKSVDGSQFFQMMADAMRGEVVLSPNLAAQMLSDMAQAPKEETPTQKTAREKVVLTNRQKEVLALVIEGYANKEIAVQLGLTESTVKHHVSQILNRYQLKSRYELGMLPKDMD